jgi:regulator of protease activity HflC (stomatin/prohibitin superfamily)
MTEFLPIFTVFVAVVALLILALGARLLMPAQLSETVTQGERGLFYRDGRFEREAGPGRYWVLFGQQLVKVPMSERIFQIMGQEILSADRLPVRVSALVTYRIVNARIATEKVEGGHHNAIYFASQLALRDTLAELPVESLIDARTKLDATLAERARDAFTEYGCDLIRFSLRDITLPGDVKRLATDVTRARMEAAAALERARGEQATLRLLANAARLVKGNPELMNLRLLQALGPAPGRPAPTVILGGNPGILPVRETGNDAPGEPSPPAND